MNITFQTYTASGMESRSGISGWIVYFQEISTFDFHVYRNVGRYIYGEERMKFLEYLSRKQ